MYMMNDVYEGLDFYLKRLHCYHDLLNSHPPVSKACGYGTIYFVINREHIEWTYNFWKQGMIEYIAKETNKR